MSAYLSEPIKGKTYCTERALALLTWLVIGHKELSMQINKIESVGIFACNQILADLHNW